MKQKDIALVVMVVFVSAVFSLALSKAIFGSPQKRQQKVEVVDPISADFSQPDPRYFNSKSVDPTQLIQIGNSKNSNPFSSTQ